MFSSRSLFKNLTTQQLQLVLTRRLLCETITIQDGDMENPFQNNEKYDYPEGKSHNGGNPKCHEKKIQ